MESPFSDYQLFRMFALPLKSGGQLWTVKKIKEDESGWKTQNSKQKQKNVLKYSLFKILSLPIFDSLPDYLAIYQNAYNGIPKNAKLHIGNH